MAYETKTVEGFDYEVRFATFKPKTELESAKALGLDIDDTEHLERIINGLENGLKVETLVPICNSLSDIIDLSEQNIYTEDYLVSCFVHGIAIKEQAKSRQTLENLARPTKLKLTKELYNKMFNKITKEQWLEISTAEDKATSLKNIIDEHFNETQNG